MDTAALQHHQVAYMFMFVDIEARRISTFATFVRDGGHSTETTFLCENSGVAGQKCIGITLRTYRSLGNRALPYRTVPRLVAAFQRGRVASADMRRTRRPRTVRPDVARAVIAQCLEDDRQWSLQELRVHTSIDQATVHKILREDLHMRKIAAKQVSHALTEQQKLCRYETCRIHLERYQSEGEKLLKNIITIDETWIRAFEPELKRQSAEYRQEGSSRRQKFRQNTSPVKLMVILAYDVQGVIMCHMVKLLMHSNMLHICKITYVAQLGVNGHNCKI